MLNQLDGERYNSLSRSTRRASRTSTMPTRITWRELRSNGQRANQDCRSRRRNGLGSIFVLRKSFTRDGYSRCCQGLRSWIVQLRSGPLTPFGARPIRDYFTLSEQDYLQLEEAVFSLRQASLETAAYLADGSIVSPRGRLLLRGPRPSIKPGASSWRRFSHLAIFFVPTVT